MWRAEDTEAATIPLRLSVEPRQFRSRDAQEQRTELDLLRDDRNYVLLGAPGAGKTTTLKRITQTLLLRDSVGDDDSYEFPIVIRLREFDFRTSLLEVIANTIGVPVTRRVEELEVDYGSPKERRTTLWVGKSPLEQAIIDVLNESRAVLILDGLDEVPTSYQTSVRRDLARLALNTKGSKILVSCRSGEYAALVEGFDLMEICPLQPPEIAAIAALWLAQPAPFLDLLGGLPYHDVADRPLLLTQLLFLYKRYGYLPEQPSHVCRKFVILLLREWDAERDVIRESRYAKFDPDRKEAFLAAIAYYLTYRVR
jgi:predicted NACHT family NTPase